MMRPTPRRVPARHLGLALALGALLLVVGSAAMPGRSRAESWCADPLVVHEWGVQVFENGGARRLGPNATLLPRYFHNAPSGPAAAGAPVRGMPVDSGLRELPVLQFYSATGFAPVPVAVEVGFRLGDASVWYPQVDTRRTAADANGAAARASRASLVQARTARTRAGAGLVAGPALLPSDPTRQLAWDNLRLTLSPTHTRAQAQVPWVDRLRRFPDALWVNSRTESERFVFYEARTTETQAVRIERGRSYAAGRRHFILRNVTRFPVFDVFLVHREGNETFLFYAPSIPANATAGFMLEQHRTTPTSFAAGGRDRMRRQLTDARAPRAPTRQARWNTSGCVMTRDPAIPVETAEGHALFAAEVDVLLEVWGARFFDAAGTTLVYREDTRALDDVMPLSIYTDMYHFVQLRRAGLALVERVQLP